MSSSQAFCPLRLSSQLLTWTTLILLGIRMQNLGLSIQCITFGLFATPFPYASFASNGPSLIVIYSMLTHWSEPPFPVASKSSISTHILLLLNISVFFFCTTLVFSNWRMAFFSILLLVSGFYNLEMLNMQTVTLSPQSSLPARSFKISPSYCVMEPSLILKASSLSLYMYLC